jgi:hypothetical protein
VTRLYVATDASGVERDGGRRWPLPAPASGPEPFAEIPGAPLDADDVPVLLRDASALLDALDERVFRAEMLEEWTPAAGRQAAPATRGEDGVAVAARRARLVSSTPWDERLAARFALDCAEHALAAAGEDGETQVRELASVLVDARRALEAGRPEDRSLVSVLARLAAAHRLRRVADRVADEAFGRYAADLAAGLEALDDPAWALLAGVRDAVLAAVEAVHEAFAFRRTRAAEPVPVGELSEPVTVVTPWGELRAGEPPRSDRLPFFVLARDAARRARAAVGDSGGPEAEAAERSWQAGRLEVLLEGTRDARGSAAEG